MSYNTGFKLCTALSATELGEAVSDYLNILQDQFYYYNDSRIVLRYICKRTVTNSV